MKTAVVLWAGPDSAAEVRRLRGKGLRVVVACDLSPRVLREAMACGPDDIVSKDGAPAPKARVSVSSERHEAVIGGRRIAGLTPSELRLLEALVAAGGRTLTRVELGHGIDKHAQSLRRKLGKLGRRLVTVRNSGYAWR